MTAVGTTRVPAPSSARRATTACTRASTHARRHTTHQTQTNVMRWWSWWCGWWWWSSSSCATVDESITAPPTRQIVGRTHRHRKFDSRRPRWWSRSSRQNTRTGSPKNCRTWCARATDRQAHHPQPQASRKPQAASRQHNHNHTHNRTRNTRYAPRTSNTPYMNRRGDGMR